jgi:hypothetical protein
MVFDDHDVTDDWNATREWRDRVWRSPGGRRMVANALAAYWAFQTWGNAPEQFDDQLLEVIAASPADERFDRKLWSFDRWSYYAPTDPPMLVLDTRTQRAFDSDRGAARPPRGHDHTAHRQAAHPALTDERRRWCPWPHRTRRSRLDVTSRRFLLGGSRHQCHPA